MKVDKLLNPLIVLCLAAFPAYADGMKGMDMTPTPIPAVGSGSAIGGPFTLTNQDGRAVTDKDYPGYKLIYFGYTNCPDECPLELGKMAKAVQLAGPKADKLTILFITTDPARDTPAKLKNYLSPFSAAHVTGLSGTPAQVAAVEKEYKVTATKEAGKNGEYSIAHSSIIYFIKPDGTLIDMYGADTDAAALAKGLQAKLP